MRLALAVSLAFSLSASAQALKTDDEKSLYAIGYLVGSRNFAPLSLKANELEIVKRGLSDGATGKKAHLVCPSDIAYGDHGHPPTIPGGATLVFDIELLAITGK